MQIVVVYDSSIRQDTTGGHCSKALRMLGHEVVHYRPLSDERAFRGYADLPTGADLYLQVDDDLAYPTLPRSIGPTAYWCIDVHRMGQMVGGGTRWERVGAFDTTFSAQRDMAMRLGVPWLPLAVDVDQWKPLPDIDKKFDWCFVGTMNKERQAATDLLKRRWPNCHVGPAYGDAQTRVYNQSRLILNMTVGNDVNMRFFEAQATGTPLLSNRVHNGEDELFSHVLYFESGAELIRQMDRVADPELDQIGRLQMAEVLERHTYSARMGQLLREVGLI